MKCKRILARFVSLKAVLIISFIVLMIISGFLGYILTAIQSQKSMHELAENNVVDLAHSVIVLIQHTMDTCHHLNVFENLHAQAMHVTLSNWVDLWYFWRPLTITNLRTVSELFYYSGVLWHAKHAFAINVKLQTVSVVNFNNTICEDQQHFPGSNCSIYGAEVYMMNLSTYQTDFSNPLITNYFVNVSELSDWQTGVISRIDPDTWVSTPEDQFNLGYSAVFTLPKVQGPPDIFIQCNAAIVDENGRFVAQNAKNVLLNFLGEFLSNITRQEKILVQNGRAFAFELTGGMLLTGASHGGVAGQVYALDVERITPSHSPDSIIAKAGKEIAPFLHGRNTQSFKVNFGLNGTSFVCACEPLLDRYGLAWSAAVVLSLTDLFHDMNNAAMRMLGITGGCILFLSVCAGLAISLVVTRPLNRLSLEMEAVAEMDLAHLGHKRSWFHEISTMQGFFHKMVNNLKEFRTFLPNAILSNENLVDSAMSPSKKDVYKRDGGGGVEVHPHRSLVSESLNRGSTMDAQRAAAIGDAHSSFSSEAHHSNSTPSTILNPQSPPLAPSHRQSQSPMSRRKSLSRQVGVLTVRSVSVLHLDIRSFHELVNNEGLLLATHTTIMQKIQEVVDPLAGSCGPILGDKLMAFWNVKTLKAEHPLLCLKAAMTIYDILKPSGPPIEVKNDDGVESPPHDRRQAQYAVAPLPSVLPHSSAMDADNLDECLVRIACTFGVASFGTVGTKTARAFTVISPCVPRGAVLQKLTKLIPVKIVCDGLMHERIQYEYSTRLVAVTHRLGQGALPASGFSLGSSAASGTGPLPEHHVYEVLGVKSASTRDEWMYELKGQEESQTRETRFAQAVRELYCGTGSGNNIASLRLLLERYATGTSHFTLPKASPTAARGAGVSDPLARWYLDHLEDIQQLIHPKWGLALPVEVLAPTSSVMPLSPSLSTAIGTVNPTAAAAAFMEDAQRLPNQPQPQQQQTNGSPPTPQPLVGASLGSK